MFIRKTKSLSSKSEGTQKTFYVELTPQELEDAIYMYICEWPSTAGLNPDQNTKVDIHFGEVSKHEGVKMNIKFTRFE